MAAADREPPLAGALGLEYRALQPRMEHSWDRAVPMREPAEQAGQQALAELESGGELARAA